MSNIFLISDTHFGHSNMYKFLHSDGTRVRKEFSCVEEGDETMVENWNRTVGVHDKVYHLGDVFINRKARTILERLNGKKVLIKGNHDIFSLENYTPYFRDIRGSHVLEKMVLTHIPIHPDTIERFKLNVHGHLHKYVVLNTDGDVDTRYYSVCVEQINYTPIELGEVIQRVELGSYNL